MQFMLAQEYVELWQPTIRLPPLLLGFVFLMDANLSVRSQLLVVQELCGIVIFDKNEVQGNKTSLDRLTTIETIYRKHCQ